MLIVYNILWYYFEQFYYYSDKNTYIIPSPIYVSYWIYISIYIEKKKEMILHFMIILTLSQVMYLRVRTKERKGWVKVCWLQTNNSHKEHKNKPESVSDYFFGIPLYKNAKFVFPYFHGFIHIIICIHTRSVIWYIFVTWFFYFPPLLILFYGTMKECCLLRWISFGLGRGMYEMPLIRKISTLVVCCEPCGKNIYSADFTMKIDFSQKRQKLLLLLHHKIIKWFPNANINI